MQVLPDIVIKPLKMFASDRISLLILVGKSGGKLAVIVRDDEIILRKVDKLNFLEIGSRISSVVEKENIDVDELIMEAVEWARKQK